MVLYTLGIITGLLFSLLIFIILIFLKNPIEREIKQRISRVRQRGSIIEPESEELNNWIKELPQE